MNGCEKLSSLAFAAILLALPVSATAAPVHLPLDGAWLTFRVEEVGSSWSESYTFSLSTGQTAWLAVTDALLPGDQFEVFANGVSLGATSLPTPDEDSLEGDPDVAFADPRWSSAQFAFAEGTWLITGLAALSPFGAALGHIRLSSTPVGGPVIEPPPATVIPLPAAGFLLLGALGGLGLLGLRSRDT